MKRSLWLCMLLILNSGCAKMVDGKLSYDYFDSLYYYEINDGVMVAYKSFDSFLSIYSYELTPVISATGTNYQVTFLAKKMSKKEASKQKSEIVYIADGYLGYPIRIKGFESDVDKVAYYDSISKKFHFLELRSAPRGAEGGSGSEEINP